MSQHCPECATPWTDGITCQDHFHQMLFWEAEDMPTRGVVHHYMVMCYHIQHPSLYSPEALKWALLRLEEFLMGGLSTEDVRKQNRDLVDSGNRKWKVTGTPDWHGSFAHPIQWTMTAVDVVARGADQYVDSVRVWAKSVYESAKESGNFPAE